MDQEKTSYDLIFKIVLIGDSSVGKTNIFSRYLNDEFDPESKSTVGVEFGTKNFKIENKIVKVQIWDTAGQERYRSITNAYYKGAKGCLLVYDITNKTSFDNLDKWISDLKSNGDDKVSIILVGNKSDLDSQRAITLEEGKQKAEFHKMAFMETSALNGNNIEKAPTTCFIIPISFHQASRCSSVSSNSLSDPIFPRIVSTSWLRKREHVSL